MLAAAGYKTVYMTNQNTKVHHKLTDMTFGVHHQMTMVRFCVCEVFKELF